MKIQTKYFDEVTVSEADLITFPKGLLGFPDQQKFALLSIPDNPSFSVLQSTMEQSVAFIVIPPHQLYQDYEFEIDDPTLELLDIESEQDVTVLGIVTLKENFSDSSINLQAPIIVNHTKRLAKQYITNNQKHSIQAPLTPTQEEGA